MDIPHGIGIDHAEGATEFDQPGKPLAVLVVYDNPGRTGSPRTAPQWPPICFPSRRMPDATLPCPRNELAGGDMDNLGGLTLAVSAAAPVIVPCLPPPYGRRPLPS